MKKLKKRKSLREEAYEALERARKKYPHFELFKPDMKRIAEDDKSPVNWYRSFDELFGDLYWLAITEGRNACKRS